MGERIGDGLPSTGNWNSGIGETQSDLAKVDQANPTQPNGNLGAGDDHQTPGIHQPNMSNPLQTGAGLLNDANGAPRIDGVALSFSEDDMALVLTALQSKVMDGQIKTAQKSLDANKQKLSAQQEQSLKKLAEAVEKCKQQQAKQKTNSILNWFKKALTFVGAVVGAVVAVAAAVASGGAAIPLAVLACAMAVNATLSLIKDIASANGKNPPWLDNLVKYTNPTGLMGMGFAKIAEKCGMSKESAEIFGTVASTVVMLGVTIALGVMSGGASAGSAFKDLSMLGKVAQIGSKFGQAAISGTSGSLEVGSSVLNYQIAGLAKAEELAHADRREIDAMVAKLLKKMEEDQDDIKKFVNELMESFQQVSSIINSAAQTRSQIASNIGGRSQMA